VASFAGNIGDNASHLGLRDLLGDVLTEPCSFTQLEIRRFYRNYARADKRSFDDDFAREANAHDLVLIGGGGFLDFWVENSATGTTLDIEESVLEGIVPPLVISSVGSHPHRRVPPDNISRFRRFLDYLLARPRTRIALRNDGSRRVIADTLGNGYADQLPTILDNGFFFTPGVNYPRICESPYIALNIGWDQIAMARSHEAAPSTGWIYDELQIVVQQLIDKSGYQIVLVPHIYKDLFGISELLSRLDDFDVRSRVLVAPHVQGDKGCLYVMSVYQNADLVLGMRFHANVCPRTMGCNSYGLAALPRVSAMFESIGESDRTVRIEPGFSAQVLERVAQPSAAGPISTPEFAQLRTDSIEFYREAFASLTDRDHASP
jgi:hypothetical protein